MWARRNFTSLNRRDAANVIILRFATPDGRTVLYFLIPGYSLRIWSAPSKSSTKADGTSRYANRLAMFLHIVVLLLNSPALEYSTRLDDFQKMLESLQVEGVDG